MNPGRSRGLVAGAVFREAILSAVSQPVASAVSAIIVAGMCAAVLLTTGRTVGAQQEILRSIDSAGTRSIVIEADADSGLDTSVLSRISTLDGIDWVGAFGSARDVTNSAIPDGTRVPIRLAWSDDFTNIGIDANLPFRDESAVASTEALRQLGMAVPAGGVVADSGAEDEIVGTISVPDYLHFLEPMVIVPQARDRLAGPEPISVLVVVASRPDLVGPVSEAVQSVLSVGDMSKVKISTSETLAQLRELVQGQLSVFGKGLVTAIFAVSALLVATILYGMVTLRRRDFGRRRALGASQRLIIGLLITQVGVISIVGSIGGSIVAAVGLVIAGYPLPDWRFFVAVAVLATVTGLVAAVIPALAAAKRDPLKELRVP